MNYIDKVEKLHLEWTSLCNARCPQCARTDNEHLALENINLEHFKQWFSPDLIKNIKHMYSCGNYGDPIVHPNCLDFVTWFLDNGCPSVALHTNGGARDKNFLRELGERKIRVTFGIDGLQDTNHIYRVGVSWQKLMQNVETFINAGGIAEWAFLVFDYNEHQINDARELAYRMNFKKFKTKISSRFALNSIIEEEKVEFKKPPPGVLMMATLNDRFVINKKNQIIRESEKFSNIHDKNLKKAIEKYGSYKSYVKNTKITCKTQKENSVYIDFKGNVWPCCWMGHRFLSSGVDSNQKLDQIYGKDFNSLHKFTLEEILSNIWFNEDLVKSWNSEQRMPVCGITCGEEFETKENQKVDEIWLKKN